MNRRLVGFVVLASLVVALVAIAILWSSQRFLLGTVDYVVQNLVAASGMSSNFARGIVILATIPFFWAVAQYTRGWFGFGKLRPSLKLYTNVHGIIIVAYVSVYFLVLFAASRESLARKWCAETREGIRVFDDPGTDPVYGTPLARCTAEQILVLRKGRIAAPQRIAMEDAEKLEFFDPVTGRAKVWYSRSSGGSYDLFSNPGTHPQTQETLRPVDGVVVQEILELVRRQVREKQIEAKHIADATKAKEDSDHQARIMAAEQQFIRTYLAVSNEVRSGPAVLAVGPDGKVDGRVTQLLSEAIGGSPDLFKPAFVNDGLFASTLAGDTAALQRLHLTMTGPAIVLASLERTHTRAEVAGESVTRATARITMRIFRGSRSTALVVEEAATAFAEAEAGRRATDSVVEKAASRLKAAM